MAQKAMEPMEKSIRFFIMMLMAFLARVKPGLHHGKAGLHEKHQEGGHQGPQIVGVGLDQIDGLFVGQHGGFGIGGNGNRGDHEGCQYQ